MRGSLILRIAYLCVAVFGVGACDRELRPQTDQPRLTPNVVMHDVTFRSAALERDIQYRVILPAVVQTGRKLPVVYLLHGGGGGFRDWSNCSDVARFAESGLILVMPEGDDSYFTDSATRPRDRYESYVLNDLIADAESRFPTASGRNHRAIIGVSMGGYGAVKLALRRPDLFVFAAGISPAIDVPSRPFSIRRFSQWRHHRSIFGPLNGQIQRDNDPFVMIQIAVPGTAPYLFLTCGDREGLLPSNRRFAMLLDRRRVAHEFHVVPGGHDWGQWNRQLDACFRSLLAHVAPS